MGRLARHELSTLGDSFRGSLASRSGSSARPLDCDEARLLQVAQHSALDLPAHAVLLEPPVRQGNVMLFAFHEA